MVENLEFISLNWKNVSHGFEGNTMFNLNLKKKPFEFWTKKAVNYLKIYDNANTPLFSLSHPMKNSKCIKQQKG